MTDRVEGTADAAGLKVAIVVSRWNELVTDNLLKGAESAFLRLGGQKENLAVVGVPGAFEVPLACQKLAGSGKCDAVVALGCIIQGETPHFDYVAGEASKGVMSASLQTGVPVGFGLLTTSSLEQALERSGGKAGNKGAEAMAVAVEMAGLLRKIG